MASTNFRVFNEANAPANTYNDSEYQNATQRLTGVIPGMALSRMHNKMYYQWSTMAAAIAQYLVSRGYDCNDNDIAGIVSALENSCGLNIRRDSTEYEVGDIAYSAALSSVLFLECTTPGTTASSIPAALTDAAEGDSITDGTVVWIVRKIASMADVRAASPGQRQASTAYDVDNMASLGSLPYGWYLECTTAGITSASDLVITSPNVGDTITDGTVTWTIRKIGSGGDGVPLGAIIAYSANDELPSGYLLCDGSAVSRTMFPDLFNAIGTTYGAGDGSTTFNVPNYNAAERFAQGSTVAGTVKSAGLPNITGYAGLCEDDSDLYRVRGESSSGAFYTKPITTYGISSASTTSRTFNEAGYFDASLSNPIYGASDTVQPYSLTVRYIIKAYDGVTPTPSEVDISEILTELTGKADRRLSNLDTANLACHVVVDSYYDSSTGDWYREYDDGWVEQGGITTTTNQQVTLLKPMDSVNYTLLVSQEGGSYADNAFNPRCQIISATEVKVGAYINSVSVPQTGVYGRGHWYVCGMGAQS